MNEKVVSLASSIDFIKEILKNCNIGHSESQDNTPKSSHPTSQVDLVEEIVIDAPEDISVNSIEEFMFEPEISENLNLQALTNQLN